MATSFRLGLDNSYAEQLDGLYAPHTPTGFPDPQVVFLNEGLLATLAVDAELVRANAAELISGNLVPEDAQPLAQAYAGHQFGGFSPQLGDGRAVLLGELRDQDGAAVDLQLKGSGRTPFSRGGDGRATLGPILREALMGEALHHLGIPTTRVLGAVTTGETVTRDGRLPGACLARTAASHLRVGTLQFFAARQDDQALQRLVDYTLRRHFPDQVGGGNPALQLLESVADAQAHLIARWMSVAFVHGVMNTDNSTLSGETLDFGPCAFMDAYDPATKFSSIDHAGRYAYGNQPTIGQWNVARLAEALLPLLSTDDDEAVALAHTGLDRFTSTYQQAFLDAMRAKIGLVDEEPGDRDLIATLLQWMHEGALDMTSTFRDLAGGIEAGAEPFCDAAFAAWFARWRARLGQADRTAVAARMNAVNPVYIARNHLVEEALAAAHDGDLEPFRTFLEVLRQPFTDQPGREAYALPAPESFGAYRTFCGT